MASDTNKHWTDETKSRNDLVERVLADVRDVLGKRVSTTPVVVPLTAADTPKLEQDTEFGVRGAFEMLKLASGK